MFNLLYLLTLFLIHLINNNQEHLSLFLLLLIRELGTQTEGPIL